MNFTAPAGLEQVVATALERLEAADFGRRLWQNDASLWSGDAAVQTGVRDALGWLTVVEEVGEGLDDLADFADELRREGYTAAVLLGMGGSSLAPEVLRRTFGVRDGFLDLRVLDSTDPTAVLGLEQSLDLARTVFIVASKSGGTTETASFHKYYFERVRERVGDEAGRQFVAITDEATSLQVEALEEGFRAVFVNPSEIGGRYSALSFFGLVPAAVIGLDLEHLVSHALAMAAACGPAVAVGENPGLRLGAALGGLAAAGRDKLTIVAAPRLVALGAWIEQLIAESTGKQGRGILPIDLEPPGEAAAYGDDRVFVHIRLENDADTEDEWSAAQEAALAELVAAGHPVITLVLDDLADVGAEFFRWEVATAAAGALLEIDPFDQPNVQESKDITKRLLGEYTESGDWPAGGVEAGAFACGDAGLEGALRDLLAGALAGGYVALQAYLPPAPATWDALQQIRGELRDHARLATTLGWGPRFLHSTGQYHKGGPASGLFIQLTCEDVEDALIPGQQYGFSVLKQAQARGDLAALHAHGRRAISVDLGADVALGLAAFGALVKRVTAHGNHGRGG
jgi:glucose-6-phosphate isomerase